MPVPQPPWPKLPNGPFTINGFPLIEFDRRPIDRTVLRGFVLGWSDEVTLVHLLDCGTYHLNGYAVFRNPDIKNWRELPKEDFLARVAPLRRLRPRMPAGMELKSMRHAINFAGANFPLITSPPGRHQEER